MSVSAYLRSGASLSFAGGDCFAAACANLYVEYQFTDSTGFASTTVEQCVCQVRGVSVQYAQHDVYGQCVCSIVSVLHGGVGILEVLLGHVFATVCIGRQPNHLDSHRTPSRSEGQREVSLFVRGQRIVRKEQGQVVQWLATTARDTQAEPRTAGTRRS